MTVTTYNSEFYNLAYSMLSPHSLARSVSQPFAYVPTKTGGGSGRKAPN